MWGPKSLSKEMYENDFHVYLHEQEQHRHHFILL